MGRLPYEKAHIGGDIEKVKENMAVLSGLMKKLQIFPEVHITYHMYKDNLQEDFDKMKELAKSLGFKFGSGWSRSINLELSLKYLRELGLSKYTGASENWFNNLQPLPKIYLETMGTRVLYKPEDFLDGKWKDVTIDDCPFNNNTFNLRWNGEYNLCACAFDDRFMAGDFLTQAPEDLYKKKRKSLLCAECITNKVGLYFNYCDVDEVNRVCREKVGMQLPDDRKI